MDPVVELSGVTRRYGLLAEGRSNIAIAADLHLASRSVEKHVTAIFTKLDLPDARTDHRRVLAVLRYQGAGPPPKPGWVP